MGKAMHSRAIEFGGQTAGKRFYHKQIKSGALTILEHNYCEKHRQGKTTIGDINPNPGRGSIGNHISSMCVAEKPSGKLLLLSGLQNLGSCKAINKNWRAGTLRNLWHGVSGNLDLQFGRRL